MINYYSSHILGSKSIAGGTILSTNVVNLHLGKCCVAASGFLLFQIVMLHNANPTTDAGQGLGSTVANDSRQELSNILIKYFNKTDLPDMIRALKRIQYLGMFTSDEQITQEDKFSFMLVHHLVEDLTNQ